MTWVNWILLVERGKVLFECVIQLIIWFINLSENLICLSLRYLRIIVYDNNVKLDMLIVPDRSRLNVAHL